MPRLEVVQGDGEEGGNCDRPCHHAPRAEQIEHEDALRDQPNNQRKRTGHTDVEADPEPWREAGAGQNGGADRDHDAPRSNADERVREAEYRALPRRKVGAASDQYTEIARQLSVGILQEVKLIEGQRECSCEADCAGNNEENRESARAFVELRW